MVDDSTDKLRRNVVVFSSAILIAALWGINGQDLYSFFKADMNRIDPVRYWLVVTVVLIYLVLRYHLQQDTETKLNRLRWSIHGISKNVISNSLEYSKGVTVEGQLENFMRSVSPRFATECEGIEMEENIQGRMPKIQVPNFEYSTLTGKIEFQAYVYFNGHTGKEPLGLGVYAERLSMPLRAKFLMDALRDQLITIFYSNDALEILAPYALAVPALFLCIYRLTNYLLN